MTEKHTPIQRQSLIDAAWALHHGGQRPTVTLLQLQFDQAPVAQLEAALDQWRREFAAAEALPPIPTTWQGLGARLYAELAPAVRAQALTEAEDRIRSLEQALQRQASDPGGAEPREAAKASAPELGNGDSEEADSQLNTLQQQLRETQSRAARDMAALELCRTNLELAEKSIDDLERQAREAQQRYTRALSDHGARIDALGAEHKKALLDLRTELNREHQQRMQQETERRQNEQRKLGAEVSAQQRRLDELEAEAESQRLDSARLNTELAAAKRENAKLLARIGELEADLENAQNRLKDARRGR